MLEKLVFNAELPLARGSALFDPGKCAAITASAQHLMGGGYQEQTKPCDICVNGIITIPDGKGGIHQAPCPRCGGTGRLPK